MHACQKVLIFQPFQDVEILFTEMLRKQFWGSSSVLLRILICLSEDVSCIVPWEMISLPLLPDLFIVDKKNHRVNKKLFLRCAHVMQPAIFENHNMHLNPEMSPPTTTFMSPPVET